MICVCDIHAIVVRCGVKEEVCRHRDHSNLGSRWAIAYGGQCSIPYKCLRRDTPERYLRVEW
jgi:hypothetical protein